MKMIEQTTATQGGSTFHEPVFSVVNTALDGRGDAAGQRARQALGEVARRVAGQMAEQVAP